MPKQTIAATELTTRSGKRSLSIRVANHFFSRLRGLMLAPPLLHDQGLLITRCRSVHTGFMRAAIDVVYLDQDGVVTECDANLRPWRGSRSGKRGIDGIRPGRARHTLELAAGSIERLQIRPGDQVLNAMFKAKPDVSETISRQPAAPVRQRGSAMVEFAVIGPVITLLGLATLQYGLLFFQKNQFNHASFMAARAGSTGNANIDAIQSAYAQALVPIYGGGTTKAALDASYVRALADVQANSKIEILNPTVESYADFNDTYLQNKIGDGKRVIPNSHQASKQVSDVRASSGQNIQDANLLKVRITTGYRPQVPVMGRLYNRTLLWMDDGSNAFNTSLLESGRIPVVSSSVVQMQSDAIEGPTVSSPGAGNGGKPTNPGKPPAPTKPSPCADGDTLCQNKPPASGGPATPGGPCSGPTCPTCSGAQSNTTTLPGDINFAFGQSALTTAGKQQLDQLVATIKNGTNSRTISSVSINGYTDQIGDATINQALSQARAQAVKDYLVSHGVTVPITATGNGAANLKKEIAQCPGQSGAALQACLAENRRVEVTLNP